MASKNLADLTPECRKKAELFLQLCEKAGVPVLVTCTARTVREQVALYAQGRQSTGEVNRLRMAAGLPPITDGQNEHCVTWTLASRHLIDLDDSRTDNDLARAFDVAILANGKPTWDIKVNVNKNEIPDYVEIGKLGESVGLVWGGRFKNRRTGKACPDYPHFEEAAA